MVSWRVFRWNCSIIRQDHQEHCQVMGRAWTPVWRGRAGGDCCLKIQGETGAVCRQRQAHYGTCAAWKDQLTRSGSCWYRPQSHRPFGDHASRRRRWCQRQPSRSEVSRRKEPRRSDGSNPQPPDARRPPDVASRGDAPANRVTSFTAIGKTKSSKIDDGVPNGGQVDALAVVFC